VKIFSVVNLVYQSVHDLLNHPITINHHSSSTVQIKVLLSKFWFAGHTLQIGFPKLHWT